MQYRYNAWRMNLELISTLQEWEWKYEGMGMEHGVPTQKNRNETLCLLPYLGELQVPSVPPSAQHLLLYLSAPSC